MTVHIVPSNQCSSLINVSNQSNESAALVAKGCFFFFGVPSKFWLIYLNVWLFHLTLSIWFLCLIFLHLFGYRNTNDISITFNTMLFSPARLRLMPSLPTNLLYLPFSIALPIFYQIHLICSLINILSFSLLYFFTKTINSQRT